MDTSLAVDQILDTILNKLPLETKFGVQAVSRRWMQISKGILRKQKTVVLVMNDCWAHPQYQYCQEHPWKPGNFIRSQHLDIVYNGVDMKLWRRISLLMPDIESIFIDLRSGLRYYDDLVKHLLETYGSQLQCLWMPSHMEGTRSDSSLILSSMTDTLPQLRHLKLFRCEMTFVEEILKFCPRLEYLDCRVAVINGNLLPKGLKKLRGNYNLTETFLTCPASKTIEEIQSITLNSDVLPENFLLPSLKVLNVIVGKEDIQSLDNLAKILERSPSLRKLSINMDVGNQANAVLREPFKKIIGYCQEITEFSLNLYRNAYEDPRNRLEINRHSVDSFTENLSLNMRKLKKLHLSFNVTSKGLYALCSLPELESFGNPAGSVLL